MQSPKHSPKYLLWRTYNHKNKQPYDTLDVTLTGEKDMGIDDTYMNDDDKDDKSRLIHQGMASSRYSPPQTKIPAISNEYNHHSKTISCN